MQQQEQQVVHMKQNINYIVEGIIQNEKMNE